MGGNAIKRGGKSICGRLPAAAYGLVKAKLLHRLAPHVAAAEVVLELPGKRSFGDVDILTVAGAATAIPHLPVAIFAARPDYVVRNGYVTSFALPWRAFIAGDAAAKKADGTVDASALPPLVRAAIAEAEADAATLDHFQVDLLRLDDLAHLQVARFYFGYSDVGSILGRIFNHHALKFGDKGLWLELYQNTVDPTTPLDTKDNMGKVMLTADPREICDFAGLDYDAWLALGNATSADTAPFYDWCAGGRLFTPKLFATLNSDHHKRAQKRPFYIGFVNYIGIAEIRRPADIGGDPNERSIRRNGQPDAAERFGCWPEIRRLAAVRAAAADRRAKFSGADVIAALKATGDAEEPTGKRVGAAIAEFKVFCTVRPADATAALSAVAPTGAEWDLFVDARTRGDMGALLAAFVRKTAPKPAAALVAAPDCFRA